MGIRTFKNLFRFDLPFCTVLVVAVVTALVPFHAGAAKLAYFQDDFFYYLQIARNIVEHGKSTFDGTTLTNGYHPLWLLAIVAAWIPGAGQLLFPIEAAIMIAGTIACYSVMRSLCETAGIDSGWTGVSSTWVALFYLTLARTGMEVTLSVPLSLLFFRYVFDGDYLSHPRRIVFAGFLASAVILSRLDMALFFLMFGILTISQGPALARSKQTAWFVMGLLPLFFYLYLNVRVFGAIDPMSSQAKHLKIGLHPDATAIYSLFSPFGLAAVVFLIPAVILILIGFGYRYLIRDASSLRLTSSFPLVEASILFPIVYFGLLSTLSDWKVWSWYRYPFVLSSVGVLMLVRGTKWFKFGDSMRPFTAGVSLLLCIGFLILLRKPPQARDVYNTAVRIQEFALKHPGRYGMGDAAGMPAFLIGQPIVQLEGLVMDQRFLTNIRKQRPLLDVLADYKVRYYVSVKVQELNGCSFVSEPAQAGVYSPHMTATICEEPVARFKTGEYEVGIFDLERGTEEKGP
jgi:hypothetical protein